MFLERGRGESGDSDGGRQQSIGILCRWNRVVSALAVDVPLRISLGLVDVFRLCICAFCGEIWVAVLLVGQYFSGLTHLNQMLNVVIIYDTEPYTLRLPRNNSVHYCSLLLCASPINSSPVSSLSTRMSKTSASRSASDPSVCFSVCLNTVSLR